MTGLFQDDVAITTSGFGYQMGSKSIPIGMQGYGLRSLKVDFCS